MSKDHQFELQWGDNSIYLTFSWLDGKYRHTVESNDGLIFFKEVNRGSLAPTFSELHVQDDLFFLSGMSLGVHWSMSISKFSTASPSPCGLEFDVACRVTAPIANRIATCYETPTTKRDRLEHQAKIWVHQADLVQRDELILVRPQQQLLEYPGTITYRYQILDWRTEVIEVE